MIRVGHGIDVHPFKADRPLILGGVKISETDGLEGHSDADAVLHALCDAILGALGAGDIGMFFPSSDPQWKGAHSKMFVKHALQFVTDRDAEICNVDITIITQKPKLSLHRLAIQNCVAQLLSLPDGRVNVKATTTDHLGFVGREEGLCAFVTVAIEEKVAPSEI